MRFCPVSPACVCVCVCRRVGGAGMSGQILPRGLPYTRVIPPRKGGVLGIPLIVSRGSGGPPAVLGCGNGMPGVPGGPAGPNGGEQLGRCDLLAPWGFPWPLASPLNPPWGMVWGPQDPGGRARGPVQAFWGGGGGEASHDEGCPGKFSPTPWRIVRCRWFMAGSVAYLPPFPPEL